jgi:transposase
MVALAAPPEQVRLDRFRDGASDAPPPALPAPLLDEARRWERGVAGLDLTPLLRSYAGRGSRPLAPGRLLAFLLYELQQGHSSPARWARDVHDSRVGGWLLRGLTPSRATLYDFRRRVGPYLEGWHRQVLQQALRRGLTAGRRASADGTLLAAYASRHRLVTAAAVRRRLALLRGVRAADEARQRRRGPGRWLGWLVAAVLLVLGWRRRPRWLAATAAGRARQEGRYRQAARRLAAAAPPRRSAARAVVSLTDPEAALGLDKLQVYRPLYNVQLLHDLDSPLVLGYGVFARQNDLGLLPPLLEQSRRLLGQLPREVAADTGFVEVRTLQWCQREAVTLYAPVRAEAAPPGGLLPRSAFTWLAAEQTYVCPAGHRLRLRSRQWEKRRDGQAVQVLHYRCPAEHCLACPRQAACTRRPATGRTLKRLAEEGLVEQLRQRLRQPAGQQVYALRSRTVERAFGDWKGHRRQVRIRGYGLEVSTTQVGLQALAHNLTVMTAVRPPGAGPQPRLPLPVVT